MARAMCGTCRTAPRRRDLGVNELGDLMERIGLHRLGSITVDEYAVGSPANAEADAMYATLR